MSRFLLLLCATSVIWPVGSTQLVLGKPPIFEDEAGFSEQKIAVEGEIIRLKCGDAELAEQYEWRIGDASGELVTSSRFTEVTASRTNDEKKYRCVAKNTVGAAISSPSMVLSKYLDGFVEKEESVLYDVTTGIGRYFVLRRPSLLASRNLDISYSWYKDSNQVTPDTTHFVTADGDLVVIGVKRSDFGKYKLLASSNDLTEIVSKEYTVQDNGMNPSIQNSLAIIHFPTDRTIIETQLPHDETFDCVTSLGGNDDVRIKWFLNNQQISGSEVGVTTSMNNRRLIISNPSGFTRGENKIECRAEGAMGRTTDQKAAYLTFVSRPALKDLPKEIQKNIGSSLILKCVVKKKTEADIKWYKDGLLMDSHRNKLIIDPIRQEDFGLYQCEASNDAGSDMKSVWVKEGDNSNGTMIMTSIDHRPVEEEFNSETPPSKKLKFFDSSKSQEQLFPFTSEIEPSQRFEKTPKNATVASGTEKLTFECGASGSPPPRLIWLLNNKEIQTDSVKYDLENEGLTIHDVKKSDEGEYTCEISGSGLKATANLQVNGDSLIEYGPNDQKILIGTNVEFSCEVAKEYARKATIEWYLNEVLLPVNGNTGLRISRNRKGSLIIRQVGPDNTGEYKCRVIVDGRDEEATAMLQIIEKPAMPERVRAELHNETMPAKVRVLWNEGFDGNEPIIKHAIEIRTMGPTGLWSDWSTVIDNIPKEDGKPCCWADIEDLRPSSTAEFRVVASNKHGSGKPSLPSSSVTMPQQPPSAAPRNVAASARSPHSVMVQWQQPKEEQNSGDVLGYVVRYRLAGYSSLSWNEKNLTTKDARNTLVDELITWREYEIQVAAYNKRGLGVFSESIEVTTAEGRPTQAPKNVRVKVLNSTAVGVDFTMPDQQRIPGVNLGYKVQFWKGEPEKSVLYKQVILDPDRKQLSTVVNELEKFGHYNFTVLCFTTPGDGPKSNPIKVITEEDTPEIVDDLSIAEVMYNGAVVTWNPPLKENGIVTKYTIRHWDSSSPDVKTRHEVDGLTTNFTIDGLQPSTRYGVDVMASTRKGDGPADETKFESGVPPELPGRPSMLSIGDISATTVQLHFTPGFDGHTAIRQWIVEGKMADSSVFSYLFNISSPKARSIVVTGLRPFTQYQLRLIAENVKGRGAPSEPSRSFETLQTYPETPSQRLFAEPVSATSISVSWTPLLATHWNGQPKGYLIVFREVDEENWKEVRTPALRSSEHTVTDLRPFTTYEVNVFSENGFGKSLPTEAVKARTYESVPSGSPRNIIATAEGSKAVIVKWDPVAELSTSGDVIGYKVRVVPERESLMSDETREVDVPGQATLITKITKLRSFTSYHVYVSAYTIVGHGPENSTPVKFESMEDVPAPPESFQCSFISEQEVRMKWLPPGSPNGKISNYIISYWKSHEPRTMAINANVLGNLLMFSTMSLMPNTQYTFAIKAENAKGESEEVIAEVTTSSIRLPVRNAPSPVRDSLSQHSPTEIAIKWDESLPRKLSEDAESPVRAVQVSYQKTNEDEWQTLDKKYEYVKRTAVIKHLIPNSMFRFRIRFIGDFMESAWSPESEWMRTLPAAPSSQPIALKAIPFERNSVLLEWVVPHKSTWFSDAVGYRIHYREYPSNETWQMEDIPIKADHEEMEQRIITKLLSFRHYILRMRLLNSEGEGPFSAPVFVFVGYSIPKRNITNLITEPTSSSSIRVKWDAWPKEDTETITSFKVRYVPVKSVLSSVSTEEEVMIVDTNECILNDLRKFTEYQISVSPYNRAGEGKMSQVRDKTLEDKPGPVGVLMFSDVLMDSAKVSWNAPAQPNGIVTGYIVNYRGYRMQEEFKNEDQQRTSRNYFDAHGLAEGVTYHFSVWAETSAGKGEQRTANVTIGPNRDGPAPPSKPQITSGQSSVTLSWNDVADSSEIIGHLIQAKRVAVAEETEQGYVFQRPRRTEKNGVTSNALTAAASASSNRPTHPIGEWISLRPTDGKSEKEQVSYRELQPSSFYVFRIFTRNVKGVGLASMETEQLFVPESIPDDPFYTTWWFMALVAMGAFVLIVIIIAILCVTGSSAKYRREKRSRSIDSLQLADENFASFQLKGTSTANMTRSRELPTRPGTTQSWLSDQSREPPAYGSVLGESRNNAGVMNMYGLATDTLPPVPSSGPPHTSFEAMQKLSALVGKDIRTQNTAFVSSSARGSDEGRNDYMPTRSDLYGTRSEYGRVEYRGHVPSSSASGSQSQNPESPRQEPEAYDSFDEEEDIGSIDDTVIRGDRTVTDGVEDIARHYGSTDQYRDTWRKVRETDMVRAPILTSGQPSSAAGRSSTTESTSEGPWATVAPNTPGLTTGFSSFV